MTKLTKIKATPSFEIALNLIENFIFNTRKELSDLDKFLDQLSTVIEFIRNNPTTPNAEEKTGDRTWPFGEGKFRIFYLVSNTTDGIEVLLTDIDANKAANLDRFPDHKISDENTFETNE